MRRPVRSDGGVYLPKTPFRTAETQATTHCPDRAVRRRCRVNVSGLLNRSSADGTGTTSLLRSNEPGLRHMTRVHDGRRASKVGLSLPETRSARDVTEGE